jgi:peptide/nickel transport system permease protein
MSSTDFTLVREATVASRRRRRGNALLIVAIVVVVAILILAVIGPTVSPFDPTLADADPFLAPPDLADLPRLLWAEITGRGTPVHWFGTDASGLDVFSRVISAPRTDLSIAVLANGFALLIGVPAGLVAGYFRNWGTETLMRVSDVLQSFPVFISAMILVALAGQSTVNIVAALAVLYSPIYVRLMRAEVMTQGARGMVEASRALGVSEVAIALKHVLPNSMGPTLVQSSVTIGFAILLTAGLSFVGAGVRPPTPEWGLMISNGASGIMLGQWWPSVFPGIAISLTVFSFAALGDVLERAYRS